MAAANQKNDFTQGKIWQVILRMAAPMALAQLVNVLYNVVDRVYIGHIPAVGSVALTGLGLTMPVVSVISAFALLCGTGGAPLCSISRGAGDLDYARRVMGNSFALLLCFGVALTLILQLWLRPILFAFGASEATWPYAGTYTRIYSLGTIFVMISLGMNSFINAQGFARTGMGTVLLGAAVNLVLDPVFIFLFHMGIAGAAIATVIAQGVSALWVLRFLTGKKAILRLDLPSLRPDGDILRRIVSLGMTGFMMSITNGLVQIVCNRQLRAYGGDLYLGVMTVINSVREVFFMLTHGMSAGAQPVLGYNYGAKAYRRVKEGIRFTSLFCMVYGAFVWAVVLLFPTAFASVFNSDPELLAACASAMRIYFAGFVFMSLQSAGQSIFVGLGKARQAIFFSLLRKVIIVVPLVLLLPGLGFGANGVFLSEPISDLLGGGACYITMYFTLYRKMEDLMK